MDNERKRRLAALAVILDVTRDDEETGAAGSDPVEYKRLLRLSSDQLYQLLARVQPTIERQDTELRVAVPAKTRLQVTLRFLASGESQFSLSHQFRLGYSTVNGILLEACLAIYQELKNDYLKSPKTEEQWKRIIEGFSEKWQFPNCCDVGAPDSQGDGGLWQTTSLRKAIEKTAGLPTTIEMEHSPILNMPSVIVGVDAFPLSVPMMKPYDGHYLPLEKRIFNYRSAGTGIL
ncbi:uncharacterized protein LOC144108743 [Amblyomma americanum]